MCCADMFRKRKFERNTIQIFRRIQIDSMQVKDFTWEKFLKCQNFAGFSDFLPIKIRRFSKFLYHHICHHSIVTIAYILSRVKHIHFEIALLMVDNVRLIIRYMAIIISLLLIFLMQEYTAVQILVFNIHGPLSQTSTALLVTEYKMIRYERYDMKHRSSTAVLIIGRVVFLDKVISYVVQNYVFSNVTAELAVHVLIEKS